MAKAEKAKLLYIMAGPECFQCCHVYAVIVPRLMDVFGIYLFFCMGVYKGFGQYDVRFITLP